MNHFSLGASSDKAYFHADKFKFKILRSTLKFIIRTSGEIVFRFRLKLKITLVESTANALSVPLCPLSLSCLLYIERKKVEVVFLLLL